MTVVAAKRLGSEEARCGLDAKQCFSFLGEVNSITPENNLSKINFSLLQLTRFLDDWAYQANVRQQLTFPDENLVKELMKPFEQKIFELLNIAPDEYNITYKFPWNRLFEVEVCISQN